MPPFKDPGTQCWHLGNTQGSFFGTPGPPWRTMWERQDGHEVVQHRLFINFEVILGPVHISFLISRSLKFHVVSGLLLGHFVYQVLN